MSVNLPGTGMADVRRALGDAIIGLLFEKRLYFEVLGRIRKEYCDRVDSVGLSIDEGGISLNINPAFFLSLDRVKRIACLEHQVLHLLFLHPLRTEERNNRIFHLACDLAVNQLMDDPLDENLFELLRSAAGDMEPYREAEYYYSVLSEIDEIPGGAQISDDHTLWRQPGQGYAGSMVDTAGQKARRDINMIIRESLSASHNRLPGRLSGHIPLAVVESESRIMENSWRRILKTQVNHALYRRSLAGVETVISRRRPNRKMGFPFPSIRVHPKKSLRVTVIVDSSGSISRERFGIFMAELDGLCRQGIGVNVIFSDSEVCHVEESGLGHAEREMLASVKYHDGVFHDISPGKWKSLMRIFASGLVAGGGGTSYVRSVERALSLKPATDCIIYFTDSYDDGELKRPRVPLIFVLTEMRRDFYPWATSILMNDS